MKIIKRLRHYFRKASDKIRCYKGAGILFYHRNQAETKILLGKRKSKIWSISGGQMACCDGGDYFHCALRETQEEFGCHKLVDDSIHQYLNNDNTIRRYPMKIIFPFIIFNWKTYFIELAKIPAKYEFPDINAQDYQIEFSDHHWFSIKDTLRSKRHCKIHFLIFPSLLWLGIRLT